ncbi:MAG: LamG domain-containing protein [Candidatus Aenigmarchaeota archaeon]|nr:LamG domain-containing protein [Candidatus Aenigmarchaeota archaeon]
MKRKGDSTLITAILLILVSIIVASMVSSWISATSAERARTVANATYSKLACQQAGIFVTNVSFDCSGSCFSGVPYSINATIENTGTAGVSLANLFLTMNDGIAYKTDGNTSTLASGDIETKRFNAIQITSFPRMPTETMDTRKQYVNDTNTVLLFHFEDGNGTSVTDAALNNTGTLVNSTTGSCTGTAAANQCPRWNASGRFGVALSFDGVNDYGNVTSSFSFNFTGNLTLEAWVYFNGLNPGTQDIVGKHNLTQGYGLGKTAGNNFVFLIGNNTGLNVTGTTTIAAGRWYHVAGAWNGTQARLFVDGAEEGSADMNGTLVNGNRPLLIGASYDFSSFLNGTIDEVRLTNMSRSFNTTLNYTVSYPNIRYVRLYNQSGQLENVSDVGSAGAGSFSAARSVNTGAAPSSSGTRTRTAGAAWQRARWRR